MEKAVCNNCDSENVELFCPNCGQKRVESRLTFKDLKTDVFANLLYFERRFVLTVKDLMLNPKTFIHNYSSGQRRRYTVPIQFFLFFLTVYLLLYNTFEREILENIKLSVGQSQQESFAAGQEKILELKSAIGLFMNYLYFLLPPIVAFYTSRFFKKSLNFAEALVLSFFSEGINLFIGTLFLLAPAVETSAQIKMLVSAIFFAYIYFRFADKWYWGVVRGLLVTFFGVATFSLIVAGCLVGVAYFKGMLT
jgi:hypothetical protein